jgi:hypothetical protein
MVDTHYHVMQRKFIWRSLLIMDFVNDGRLTQSFAERRIVGFELLDIANRHNRGDGYEAFVDSWKVAALTTTSVLYIGLAVFSLFLYFAPIWHPRTAEAVDDIGAYLVGTKQGQLMCDGAA